MSRGSIRRTRSLGDFQHVKISQDHVNPDYLDEVQVLTLGLLKIHKLLIGLHISMYLRSPIPNKCVVSLEILASEKPIQCKPRQPPNPPAVLISILNIRRQMFPNFLMKAFFQRVVYARLAFGDIYIYITVPIAWVV